MWHLPQLRKSAETPLIASHFFLWMSSRRSHYITCKYRLSMYYYMKFLCYNLMKVMKNQYRWEWKDLRSKNGRMDLNRAVASWLEMMCRSSRIVGLIACRVIRAGRVTIRKLVGRCRVLIWWGIDNPGKEYVTQDGGIEKPFAFMVGVFSIGKWVGVGNWKHLSVDILRRWRWWHCDWGIVI